MIDLLEKTVDKARVALFKRGADNAPTYIKQIGYEWESFGAIEGDKAKRIECETNSIYTILYFAPKGSKFPPHFHMNKESGIVMSGKAKIETPTECFIKAASETYEIDPEIWHKFTFLADTTLMIQFYPPFLNDEWIGNLK